MSDEKPRRSFTISPIFGTIAVALIGLLGTGLGASIGGYFNIKLEEQKLRSNLILKAVDTDDPKDALNYLKLLKETKLVDDIETTIESWEEDLESVPLRPVNQQAIEGLGSSDKDTRLASFEELVAQNAESDPAVIEEFLMKLDKSNWSSITTNGLYNTFIFLNLSREDAWTSELKNLAQRKVSELESGYTNIGPKTKGLIEKFKSKLARM